MTRFPLAILAIALCAVFAPPAGAVTTPSPLAGSTFQGGDGDQANPGGDVSSPADGIPDVDWQAVAGQVVTSDDPSPDNEFQNGSHEQAPHDWDIGTAATGQVNPSKSNILAAWTLTDPTSTDTFLYLAFKREATTGNTFLSFDLNSRTDTWVNDNGDTIPCRTTGDTLVSYEVPSANSTDVNIMVYRWTSATVDAATGCARTGTFTAASPSSFQAQGTLNPGAVTNYLNPGLYGATFAGGSFGEAAINLTAILTSLGNPCFSFGQISMHSRSSESIDSALQDYVAPVPLIARSCSVSGTKFNDLDGDGTRDGGEPGLAGWTFYVDYDDDGVLDPGEPSAVSGANGSYTIGGVSPGTFKVREEAQTGWFCTSPSPNCFHTVTFTNGNQTGRDFGNTRQASVKIIKDSVPDDPADVSFTTTGTGLSDFQLDDDGDETNALKRERSFTGLSSFGTKTVTETVPAGFTLTGISCSGDTDVQIGADADFDAGDTTVTIDLDSGEDVVCTFTNAKRGTVEIEKQTDPANATDTFGFAATDFPGTADDSFSLNDDGVKSVSVAPGSYMVTENDPTPTYDLTGLTCNDGQSATPSTTSVPSRQATVNVEPGETVRCTFTNTKRGTVEIEKQTNPTNPTDLFGFTATDLPGTGDDAFSLSDDGVKSVTVAPGAYQVSEDDPTPAYDLTGLSCDDGQSATPSTTSLANRLATVNVDAGETVRCTFTNTKRGQLEIEKQTDPANPTDSFGFAAPSLPGAADDSFSLNDDGVKTVAVAPGAYSVTEDDPTPAHDLTGLTCDDALSATPSTTSVASREAVVNVDPGETVRCTFTNTKRGTVEIEKQTDPANATDTFDFSATSLPGTADDTFTLGDDGVKAVADLAPGAYDVTEDDPAPPYALSSIACDDGQSAAPSTGDVPSRTATVNVDPGETVRCVFTNTRTTGKLEVVKNLDPAGDGGRFDLQIDGATEKANAGDGDTTGEKTLPTGDHTVGEIAAAGTDLADYDSSIECRAGDGQGAVVASSQDTGPLTVAVTTGSDIVCVITNTRLVGQVAGVKFEDSDRDGAAREAGEPGLQGWTIYIDQDNDETRDAGEPSTTTAADGSWSIGGLVSGDYVIREEQQQGFDCTFPNPCRYTVTLAPGENRTGVDFGNAPLPPAPTPRTEPTPPPPTEPPPTEPTPPPQVAPAVVVPAGFARLVGPSGCVGRSFLARVRGRSIARVVFYLDGRRIKTLRRADRKGRWGVRINPNRLASGGHRLRARVTFVRGSGSRPRTFNLRFQRCVQAVAPDFTG